MKKKICAVLLGICVLLMAAGCSASKGEPENVPEAAEEQPEADAGGQKEDEASTSQESVLEPEEAAEAEEIPVDAKDVPGAFVSRIPLENGQPDENTTAVVYYEFKKDYTTEKAGVPGLLEFKIPQLTMRSMEAGRINEDILEYFEDQLEEMDENMEELAKDWGTLDSVYEITISISYELTCLDDNKICFLLSGYEGHSAAAHGMPFRESLIYSLENGEEMEAEDLFTVSEDVFAAAFVEAFEKKIAQSPENYWEDAMDYVREEASFDNDDFYLTESGVVFYFEPYVLAAYANGYVEAEIPYETLGVK